MKDGINHLTREVKTILFSRTNMDKNNRDLSLKNIRPTIPMIIEEAATSAEERFQNTCLRPILKFQNDLLIGVFKSYLAFRKGKFYTLSKPKKLEYIEDTIRKDLKFKNLLIGIIVGQFTVEEWEVYHSHERELRKRVTGLLVQRIQSFYNE